MKEKEGKGRRRGNKRWKDIMGMGTDTTNLSLVNTLTDNTAQEAIGKLENRRIEITHSGIQKKRGCEVLRCRGFGDPGVPRVKGTNQVW